MLTPAEIEAAKSATIAVDFQYLHSLEDAKKCAHCSEVEAVAREAVNFAKYLAGNEWQGSTEGRYQYLIDRARACGLTE